MGRDLYAAEPVFRATVDSCADHANQFLGRDLREILLGDDEDLLQQTRFAQPALFTIELALAGLLSSWGIHSAAMLGHSVGEYAAATLAGVFTPEQAIRLVCARGRLMQTMDRGGMTSIARSEAEVAPWLTGGLSLAATNSPRACVVAGTFSALEVLEAKLTRQDIAFRRLKTSHAFHSAMMEPMLASFQAEFADITCGAPSSPFVSSVTGTWITAQQTMDPRYWVSQCRLPVRFSDAIQTLIAQGINLFLETGPGEALTVLTNHNRQQESQFRALAALPRKDTTSAALAELWAAGCNVDWTAFYSAERRQRVSLPTYPFERKLHWIDAPKRQSQSLLAGKPNASETETMEHSALPASPLPDIQEPRRLRIQRRIAEVFTELSGIETGPDETDHQFLELGFDSLFLTQATQSLQRAFAVKLTFRQLMEQYSTIESLGDYLDSVLPASALQAAPQPSPVVSGAAAPTDASQPLERLLADQLAALSELFAQQVAMLRAAASGTVLQPPAPLAAKRSGTVPQASSAEVKHGSFRPIQAKAQHDVDASQQRYLAELIARYEARTPGSKAATATWRTHLADPRAVAGFRPQWKEMVYPLVTERALGSRLWDVDGNEYIDIVNGYGCILFGHSPKFVVDAVRDQLDRGVAIGPQSALAGEVAALLCELTGNERATFCNTGSEAVMAAIRVARTVTGRDKIIYFGGDYHGTFDEVLVRNTPRGSAPVAPGIPLANTTNVMVLEYGTDASLAWLREHGEELAAVLIEPVQTRNPALQPFDFIREVRRITEGAGAAMILDEVVTGFRLAPGGVQEMLGIRADLCTYGKVIGGGHPIGVLSGKAMYLDALDGGAWQYGDDSGPEVGVTFFAGTFVRHPLVLAAARSVLLHLKEQGPALQQDLNRKTAALAGSLDAFFAARGIPCHVHHFASWFYFTFPHDLRLGSLLYYAMRARGIHIQEGYPCFLTTAHSDADLAEIERAFRDTILEMQAGGALPQGPALQEERAAPLHAYALAETPVRTPLTEPQREIFLAAALSDEANCAFNESLTLTLRGPVRAADLSFALDAVVARHDALRSTVSEDGEALCFAPAFSGQTEFIDLRETEPARQQDVIQSRIRLEGRTPFDLHQGPLLRSLCFQISDHEAVVLLTAHHMVLDGWSANQLLEEVGKIYSGGAAALTALAPLLPFSSYAVRENARSEAGQFAANEAYWVHGFSGRTPRLELPLDRPRPAEKTYSGATLEGSLGSTLYARLKQLSAKNGCTLYVTLLSGFQLLLHRLSGQAEVVTGISTAGQALYEGASLVGHCVHFLPMLSVLASDETVQQHLRATRTALLDAYDHQEFTYGSLLHKLRLERDRSRLPLIEVQFNLERVGANVQFQDLQAEIRTNAKQFVNTDLFLNVMETTDDLQFACDFNTDLFDRATVQRWMGLWAELLGNAASDASLPILETVMLPVAERTQVLYAWNETGVDFGEFQPTHALVLQEAALHPERTAVVCGGRQWSYAELAEYSTLVARRLLREGLQPGGLVGICIERSLEMVGAILAVMMAGGAYVPLDPRHPRERLANVMHDAGLSLLLTGRDPSVEATAKIVRLSGPQPQGTEKLPTAIPADALAYVIYTSGSTGVPKGVAIEHGALRNLLLSMQREPGFRAEDVLVAVTTLAFDIAGLELLLPLITGAKLVVATEEQVQDGVQLLNLLASSGATILQATPGAWRLLIDAGWSGEHKLKVLCGGEALPRELADKLLERSADVWNMYGPTETTIWSAATRVAHGSVALSLGTPIANTQFYILDEHLAPLPIGVTGQLWIGGEGLARGYWHNDELTADKFRENHFAAGRIYATGDLARWRGDGTLDLLGRADFQVKLRGYRIELGEIESALSRHSQVREAVVLAQDGRLAAFVAVGPQFSSPDLLQQLKDLLARTLPEYMRPAIISTVDELPRTPNGKVDRKALPQLISQGQTAVESRAAALVPAVTEQQKQLATIWSEVLYPEGERPAVSIAASIFELGADSLVIFRIAARAQREGLPIKATDIFQRLTIRALCEALDGVEQIAVAPRVARIGAASREGYRMTKVKLDA